MPKTTNKSTPKVKSVAATPDSNLGRPLADRVIVEQDQADERTASGLYIPQSAQERPERGIVKAVGPGRTKDEPTSVSIGDKVLYGAYAGTEVTLQGKTYLIMRESDILMVL